MNIISRFRNLVENTVVLSPLLGGPYKSLSYLVSTKGQPNAMREGNYKGIPFQFRRADVPALKEIFFKEEYGGFVADILKRKEKPFILDVGAHIGLFAIWAYSINPKTEIHSIEASPSTYKILSYNINANQFNWHSENKAAWGLNEMIRFADDLESTMSHRVNQDGSIKIQTITLAELTKGKIVDLLKVDIEGAEESFLTARDACFDNIQNLVMELHPAYCNGDKVMEVLEKNYKTITNIKDSDKKPVLFCSK
jgi:FkbM family methyltransferase